jgi:hypothetical protein
LDAQRWLNQHVYRAWNNIVSRCESFVNSKVLSLLFFQKTTVRERLMQLLESTGFQPFSCLCVQRLESGEVPVPPVEEILNVGGLVIHPDGRVAISSRLLVRALASFAFLWLRLLGDILLGCLPYRGRDNKPTTLFFGISISQVLHQDCDTRFVQYCRQGPIQFLAEAQRIFVEAIGTEGSISDPDFVYASHPVRALVRESGLGVGERVGLLFAHLSVIPIFLSSVIRFPFLSLLARDIAYAPAVRALDHKGLIEAVVTTNSNLSYQPLWMRESANRGFRVHMIHYSQNSMPFVYVSDPFVSEYPAWHYARVDEHWVWTPGYMNRLRELGHQDAIHVIGPIMFYLPELPLLRVEDKICVAVFDVTPVYAEKARELGVVNNYYDTENMVQFIEDIVGVFRELESRLGKSVRILLKHKRAFSEGFHDQSYIDFVKSLSENHPQFDLVQHSENLFSMLASSDLSISIPYTSVAYISSHLGNRAIYFDPSQELLPSHEPTPFIEFASGRAQLLQIVERAFVEVPGC